MPFRAQIMDRPWQVYRPILVVEMAMAQLKERTTNWLTWMLVAAVFLTPVLAVLNLLSPVSLPWIFVFVPWIGSLHLLFCWFAGQMIARVLFDLYQMAGGR